MKKKYGSLFALALVLLCGKCQANSISLSDMYALIAKGVVFRVWDTSGALPFPVTPPPPVNPFPAPTTPIDEVNYICAQWDSNVKVTTVPFDTTVAAYEMHPSQPLYVVRLTTSNPYGVWLMQSEYVRGLTPDQLRENFALPSPPTSYVTVRIPAYSETLPNGKHVAFWIGPAGPILTPPDVWGAGGAAQIRLIADPPSTTNYFPDYGFMGLPAWRNQYYFHFQTLGQNALYYAPLAGGGNPGRVANYLDGYIPAALSDLAEVYYALDWLNYPGFGAAPLQDALNQIGAARFDSLSYLGFRSALLFGNALFDREELLHQALWTKECCTQCCGRTLCPGTWIQGIGELGDVRRSGENYGFDYQTAGFTLGGDAFLTSQLALGWGASYLGSYFCWDTNAGKAHVDQAKIGAYGTYLCNALFVDALCSFGLSWAHTHRNIQFADDFFLGGINRIATARETGYDIDAQLEGGYRFTLCNWWLTPLARLSYFHIKEDHFHEKGADSLDLHVKDFHADTWRTYLELGFSRLYEMCCSLQMLPNLHLGWAHNFALDHRSISSSLEEIDDSYSVNGFFDGENNLVAGAEVALLTAKAMILSSRYDAEIGKHFTSHEVSINARVMF